MTKRDRNIFRNRYIVGMGHDLNSQYPFTNFHPRVSLPISAHAKKIFSFEGPQMGE